MTHPIDTSPEAIAAQPVAWRCRDEYGVVCFTQDPDIASTYPKSMALYAETALAAEMARLTAAVHELESTVTETEGRAQDAIAQMRAERDEARAQLAILYGEEGMGNVTPADASTALAARDAAMRNEGRRRVKVKPLEWKEATGDDYRKGECFYARSIIDLTPISVTNSRNGWWLNTNSETYPTIDAAKAAAQADYEARILAALEPEGEP